jgi:hypothetical protein
MAVYTPAQLRSAITKLYSDAKMPTPGAGALSYYSGKGQAGLDLLRGNLAKDRRSALYRPPTSPTASPDAALSANVPQDPAQTFLDQIKPLLQRPDQPKITPFDQSGFYNEGDTKALADTEYDPFYAKRRALDATSRSEEDRQRGIQEVQGDRNNAEAVNAAGGYRSSAYQRDIGDVTSLRSSQTAQRKMALDRALEEEANQQKADKSGFVTNRRNEAFQRYLQSIGAVAA